jgi:hypothetical protein
MPSFDDYIVFVDESGDHSLTRINPIYPLFVLAFCLFKKSDYADQTVTDIINFKFQFFGHPEIVLHEREMRKEKGAFRILQNVNVRNPFMQGLSDIIDGNNFTLFASAIKKIDFKRRYSNPENPYNIAMQFGLERIYLHLRKLGCNSGQVYFVFEGRGKKEDAALELAFLRTLTRNATGNHLPFEIIIASKKCNSSGLQFADLIARPIGLKILRPKQPNRAYDVIRTKLARSFSGDVLGYGLKIFP